MPDNKKYYDVNGKEISIPAPKQYYDANASPIQLNPTTAGKFGSELDVPQTKSDVEGVVAPYLGRLAANSLPAIGSALAPETFGAGTAIGTGVSAILKGAFPKVFGDPPENVSREGLKDLVVNNIVPSAIGKGVELGSRGVRAGAAYLGRNLPGVREGAVQEMTNQILNKYEQPATQILNKSANQAAKSYGTGEYQPIKVTPGQKYVPQTKTTDFQPATPPTVQPEGPTKFQGDEISQKLARLDQGLMHPEEATRIQSYDELSKMAVSDPNFARSFKAAAGAENFDNLAINNLLKNRGKAGEVLDTGKILKELKTNEVYGEVNPATLSNFRDLVNEVHAQQTGHGAMDSLIKISKGRLLWAGVGLGSAFGFHAGTAGVAATAGGIVLTDHVLGKLMSNPETARVVVEAMRTPAMSAKGQMINQILGNLWKGGADLATVPEK